MLNPIVSTKDGSSPSKEERDAANTVAAMYQNRPIGVFPMSINGVDVEYHAHKNVAVVSSNISSYFGFNGSVQMWGWGKGLFIYFSHAGGISGLGSGTFVIGFTDGTVLLEGNYSWSGNGLGQAAYAVWDGHQTVTIFTITNNQYVATPYFVNIAEDDWILNVNLDGFRSDLKLQAQRQHMLRKKCSDDIYEALKNGILPIELEYFIKTQPATSAKLRRKIPMKVVSGPTYVTDSQTTPGIYPHTMLGTGSVTLEYVTTTDGVEQTHQETFVGAVSRIQDRFIDPTSGIQYFSYSHTFNNFPLLSSQIPESGNAFFPSSSPITTAARFLGLNAIEETTGLFIADLEVDNNPSFILDKYSLFAVVDGNWVDSQNKADNRYRSLYSAISFNPKYIPLDLIPGIPWSSYDLEFKHPQFIYEYLKNSPPVEIKEGEVASQNWLSSRLTNGEEVTIIPLSFVLSDGTDRGMFILSRTDEAVVNIKVTGYAKAKYNEETGSFNEPTWKELDEPQFIPFNPTWTTQNCICISNKNPWSDTKEAAQLQKKNISDNPPEGYVLTAEERLYKEIRTAIRPS